MTLKNNIQYAICFKWRQIPMKEKYELIVACPFLCEAGREWKPDIYIKQDHSQFWKIDKPNIPQMLPGGNRLALKTTSNDIHVTGSKKDQQIHMSDNYIFEDVNAAVACPNSGQWLQQLAISCRHRKPEQCL
ncbi:uncharacterized protein LOC127260331 [Andrographis paniculata]|uniref:uncharacterized protein LOC127260331 n=1 Tax=Andrographis paniculata TaxID=175694 RepID=UPI0021E79EEE|nr:uncharacterized protein LOC127260331 [Andrographis paniculata]